MMKAGRKIALGGLGGLALVAAALFGGTLFYGAKTLSDLLQTNKQLKIAITNLTSEDQIGYAKVLKQTKRDGELYTTLLFVETDRNDPAKRILERKYRIKGDVIHFDALIVKFGSKYVMDGTEKALYMWRRVYGEHQAPADGYPIEMPGDEPRRYAGLLDRLSIKNKKLFWKDIWKLSDNPEALKKLGVRAINGHAVYKALRPGFIYVMKIDHSGGLFIESVPDL